MTGVQSGNDWSTQLRSIEAQILNWLGLDSGPAQPSGTTPQPAQGLDQLMASPSPLDRFGTPPGSRYTVRAGDTLTDIARAHGTSVGTLARINGIANPDRIQAGQVLRLPQATARTHTVRPGETLSGIAAQHGTTVNRLARTNNIRDVDVIRPGQQLRLDGPSGTPPHTVRPGRPPAGPAPAAPVSPAAPASPTVAGQINLRAFFDPSRGSASPAAIVIGNAEGTRTPSGGTTSAYNGHVDPGNSAQNRGSFSLQGAAGSTAEQADRTQLARLTGRIPVYEEAARRAGLDPANATLATAYFDLYNQSPTAAARFLNQLDTLRTAGISQASVTDLRFHSFVDRSTGQRFEGAGGGFARIAADRLERAPTEREVQAVIRSDQTRRQNAMARAMTTQGIGTAAPPVPRAPAAPGAPAEAIRFGRNPGLDLPAQTIASANGLYDRIRAQTGHAIHVTSGRRGPDRQAAAMYDNYADGTAPRYANRTAEAEVRATYDAGRAQGLGRAGTVRAMTAVLQAQVDRGVYISRHMSARAIDIRTPPANVVAAIRADPSVQSAAMENDHLHIQFR